jgi:hypothetical protein
MSEKKVCKHRPMMRKEAVISDTRRAEDEESLGVKQSHWSNKCL